MRLLLLLLIALVFVAPRAWSQQVLPELGDVSASALSPQMERRIGESVMRDVRGDPSYLDDPEISEYLNTLGSRLVAASPGAPLDFEFFAMRDPAINAFALPGGFVGVHTGLLTAAESESELASVLAHEIAHVTQHHIARLSRVQQQTQLPSTIAMLAALIAARSRPDLAMGAMAATQAGIVQTQINYTRDFEREADRIGFQTLEKAGFDVRGMSSFFEKLQRNSRVSDDGTAPGYLRTHPLTTERVAEAANRMQNAPYRQIVDSLEFQLVRAKLRAAVGEARDAVVFFAGVLRDGRYANETAARFGLVTALLRNRQPAEAVAELARLRASTTAKNPMIDALAARVLQAAGNRAGALAAYREALGRNPYYRPLVYDYLSALQEAGSNDAVLAAVDQQMRIYPHDARLYAFRAKAYAALGKRLLQHQSQAEVYHLQGSLPAAIEQLQLARNAGDGDFYELSAVEARLRDLRAQQADEEKQKRLR